MKEFEGIFQDKDKMEISIQKKQQKEKVLVGKIIPHEGHTIWEINDSTLEIKKVEFEKKTYLIFDKKKYNPEVITRNGYSYISALNKKGALKKYKQGKNGSKVMGDLEMKLF
jgi:hypothetical protein